MNNHQNNNFEIIPKPVLRIIFDFANQWNIRGVCRLFRKNHCYRFNIDDFFPLCKRGTIETLKWYLSQFPNQNFSAGVYQSFRIDVIELFKKYHGIKFDWTFYKACKKGNMQIFNALVNENVNLSTGLLFACSKSRNNIIEILASKTKITKAHLVELCTDGNIEMFEKLRDQYSDVDHLAGFACDRGQFGVVLHLMKLGATKCFNCSNGPDIFKCPINHSAKTSLTE